MDKEKLNRIVESFNNIANDFNLNFGMEEKDDMVELWLERDYYVDDGYGNVGYINVCFKTIIDKKKDCFKIVPLVEDMTQEEFEKYVNDISKYIIPPVEFYDVNETQIQNFIDFAKENNVITDEEAKKTS